MMVAKHSILSKRLITIWILVKSFTPRTLKLTRTTRHRWASSCHRCGVVLVQHGVFLVAIPIHKPYTRQNRKHIHLQFPSPHGLYMQAPLSARISIIVGATLCLNPHQVTNLITITTNLTSQPHLWNALHLRKNILPSSQVALVWHAFMHIILKTQSPKRHWWSKKNRAMRTIIHGAELECTLRG